MKQKFRDPNLKWLRLPPLQYLINLTPDVNYGIISSKTLTRALAKILARIRRNIPSICCDLITSLYLQACICYEHKKFSSAEKK